MNVNILLYLGCCVLSLLVGLAFIPAVLKYCKKHGLYDIPGDRHVHTVKVPRLGGVVFLPGMLLAFLVMIVTFSISNDYDATIHVSLWSVMFFVGLAVVYATGLVDDVAELKAGTKFMMQILAASIMPLAGLYFNNLYGFCGIHEVSIWVGAPMTVLAIVFINNAINLIDGIDGLSSSLSILALCGFIFLFHTDGLNLYGMLIAGLIGVLLSFIPYNLFGNAEKGTKIFMGDSGSLTIGFILGFLVVKYSCCVPQLEYSENRIIMALALIAVPILDVFRVMLSRVRDHVSIFSPDKRHIHHKLMRAGYTQHQTLRRILYLAITFIVLTAVLQHFGVRNELVVGADLLLWCLFHAWLNIKIRKHEQPSAC